MMEEGFTAADTIFAQFESERLRECLKACAATLGRQIVWGRADYPDLLAVPAFAVVIDRSVVGSETYDHYLQMIEEFNSPAKQRMGDEDVRVHQTCIIVDDLAGLGIPRFSTVLQLDELRPDLEDWLLRALALSASTHLPGRVVQPGNDAS